VPACPAGEVYVPRPPPDGFTLGDGSPGERDAATRVMLSKPFCLDEVEVTVAEYRRCVLERGCSLPELRDPNSNYRFGEARNDHPVNLVSFDQAQYFCQTLGKQLPTEAQWKWAAGHGDGRKYPWGDEDPRCDNGLADFTPGGAPKATPAGDVGCHGGGTSPVKTHPRGNSSWPSGDLFDLGGNVWEWTRDCYLPYPSGSVVDPSPQAHPALKGQCFVRALVGGGWNRSHEALKIRFRAGSRHTYRVPGLGFRCLREER
jgi:formylglycine-generating enzyme required for sulfatase activity